MEEQVSRKLTYILRHNAIKQGIHMRKDGFVKVTELLALPYFHSLDFMTLERVVAQDNKKRYTLLYEPETSGAESMWWIRANQGHSIETVEIDMIPVTSPEQVIMAVHGTNKRAWERIAVEGLSRMKRQHIHFAQGIPGSGVISGMRTTSQVYIHLNVPMALEAGLKLMISSNEVVCCPGDENGFVSPRFFRRVEWAGNRQAVPGWDKPRQFLSPSTPIKETLSQPDSPH
ncbi:KptA family-domain-containing protein [Gautieria morchelliformis]|nr:KptA family-domain-containing protein [Gautieria morchelliformis]